MKIKIEPLRNMHLKLRASAKIALAFALFIGFATASEQILAPGDIPCEADWMKRSQFGTVSTTVAMEYIKRKAELGQVPAQLRLGLLRATADGTWSAPLDRSFNMHWLGKAAEQGSASAVWEIKKLQTRQTTHESYLRSAIAAAEEEGNPWAATELMNFTTGRWGERRSPVQCDPTVRPDNQCAPADLLPLTSASKWARIAAEGGNVVAQEWICKAATTGDLTHGQPQDPAIALKWCQIAIQNSCAFVSLGYLHILLQRADRITPLVEDPALIRKRELQPWRKDANLFFN